MNLKIKQVISVLLILPHFTLASLHYKLFFNKYLKASLQSIFYSINVPKKKQAKKCFLVLVTDAVFATLEEIIVM